MKYEFNGKNLTIPDTEIEKSMRLFHLTKQEAIEMWLDDEGYTENAEVEELSKKAKTNKAVQHEAKDIGKKRKPTVREPKSDPEKENLIVGIEKFLNEYGAENVNVTNKTKVVEFNIGENHYKLDLIRQRKPKNE